MRRVTIDQIIKWKPCAEYNRDRLQELFGKRKTLTAEDIAKLDIRDDDILWALIRMIKNKKDKILFACACVSRGVNLAYKEGTDEYREAKRIIKRFRKYAHGEINIEKLRELQEKSDDYTSKTASLTLILFEDWSIDDMLFEATYDAIDHMEYDQYKKEVKRQINLAVKTINKEEKE
jgi:hypothetical protein